MAKFEVEKLWHNYLELVGMKEEQLPHVQRSEMKKAFFGGVGQVLMLLRDDLGALPEEEGVIEMNNLIEETKRFWIIVSLTYN